MTRVKTFPTISDKAKRAQLMNDVKKVLEKHGLEGFFGTFTIDQLAKQVRVKLTLHEKQAVKKVKVGSKIVFGNKNFIVTKAVPTGWQVEQRSKWTHDIPLANPKFFTLRDEMIADGRCQVL